MSEIPLQTIFEQTNSDELADLVTVAVSLRRSPEFLCECLVSLCNQIDSNLDLVVVDDAANNSQTLAVVQDWLANVSTRFQRLTLIRHLHRHGLSQTRNTGIAYARGDLVFVIDADHEVYPRAISRLNQVMAGGNFGAAYSQLELFGKEQGIGDADFWQLNYFKFEQRDAMSLVSKQAWATVGKYPKIEEGWVDYEFWCNFVDHGLSAAFVPEILCRYRLLETSPERQLLHASSRQERQLVNASTKPELSLRHPWLKAVFEG